MTERKRRPPQEPAPSKTTAKLHPQCTADFDPLDFDERVEQQIEWSIWRALRRGEFRLAVQCHRCRRWLHNPNSKRTHRERCAAQTKR